MNPTMFDPIALENWYSDDENSLLLQTELEKYFQNYLPCFRSEPLIIPHCEIRSGTWFRSTSFS